MRRFAVALAAALRSKGRLHRSLAEAFDAQTAALGGP
jgi:hypothetical protein